MTNHRLTQESSNFREAMVPEAPTLIDELESSAEGAQEMAAARLAVEVTASFSPAFLRSASVKFSTSVPVQSAKS
jgi:hypothetical protein